MHISVLNSALWDLGQVHCEICKFGLLNYYCASLTKPYPHKIGHIDGLMQDWSISIANALKIRQSCIKPSIFIFNQDVCEDVQLKPPSPVPSGPSGLPFWCLPIAWLLVVISILVSAFFCILYSQQWGKYSAQRWLGTLILEICVDVLILDPLIVSTLQRWVYNIRM